MSGSQAAMAKPPKTMSSRLLTMKFMQRAAASASLVTPNEPSLKRQKLSSPASPAAPSPDWQATPASQKFLNRQAAEAGETHWVLSFQENRETSKRKAPLVIGTGFAGLDDPKASELRDDEQDGQGWRSNSVVGRKRFGNFTHVWEGYARFIDIEKSYQNAKESPQDEPTPSSHKVSGSDDDDVDDNDDDADDHPPPPDNSKGSSGGAKSRQGALREARKEAEEERKEKKLLRGISSISGGGGQGDQQRTGKRREVQCYKCGKSGHIVRDCPQRR
ncbi:MAG: hypothetical protein M1840_005959 [Geoglossum simile]|nr:MAG: hypothetical protein M1840_005959 [Geoglossum simile]